MERASLDGLPELTPPEGYRLRSYRSGDEPAWCRLVNERIGGDYTREKMAAELLDKPWFSPADLCFVESEGEVVGTACALRQEDFDQGIGWLHMVVVARDHGGRGLGRAVVLAVLHRFRELGCRGVALSTDDHRLAAIRVYLSLGFRPKLFHESHPQRWREVYQKLGYREEPGA